jgi:hypothetical protein
MVAEAKVIVPARADRKTDFCGLIFLFFILTLY